MPELVPVYTKMPPPDEPMKCALCRKKGKAPDVRMYRLNARVRFESGPRWVYLCAVSFCRECVEMAARMGGERMFERQALRALRRRAKRQ